MHVVPHDGIAVEIVMAKKLCAIVNGFDDHARDLRLTKVQRAGTGVIENAIHRQKGFSRGSRRWEAAAWRKAIVQPPSEENSLADGVIMWQAAGVKGHQQYRVRRETKFSGRLPIGRRLS